MSLKPCLTRSCPNYTERTYCVDCERRRAQQGVDRGGTRDRWRQDRARALDRARHRCIVCGQPATAVHHRDLNRHNNTPANLEALCDRCHIDRHRQARAEHHRTLSA